MHAGPDSSLVVELFNVQTAPVANRIDAHEWRGESYCNWSDPEPGTPAVQTAVRSVLLPQNNVPSSSLAKSNKPQAAYYRRVTDFELKGQRCDILCGIPSTIAGCCSGATAPPFDAGQMAHTEREGPTSRKVKHLLELVSVLSTLCVD